MEYQIITFGNGEILNGVFNAIATCLNAHSGTLYIPLIRLSVIIGCLWAALYAIYGDYIKAISGWIIPMTAITQLLFVPQATVWIKDPVSRYHQKVDHVPYGLAMISGYISKIGYAITEQVEKIFVLPDDLKYQKTGTLFASNLLQQAKTFRITNEDLAENLRQFVGQCVAYDAILGRKYTIEDLRHSADIWNLISSQASPVRSFLWRNLRKENELGSRSQIITCQEGVKLFNQAWGSEINKTATLFGKKIFGQNDAINAKSELLKYLPIAYGALTNMAKSAEEILKQNMMIYAVVDGIEQKSTSLGNAPNFALKRAYLQQRSTYETLGAMAAETLPTMKAVLEAIAYATFLFVIPLAILPFGWRFLTSWVQILLWLQMWAPLYAVLNYIMTMAARSKSISALSLSNEAGITIANSVGLVNVNADIAAMAGYLAMSIPFLCIALVKGVGSFVHLASHLSHVTQGAASSAANDAVTGNYSFGNITEGNRQIANTNMLSQSYAASYRSGSFHQADGRSDILTTADGQQILNVTSSNVPVSINAAETQSSQLSENASRHYQKAVNQSMASSKSLASSYRNMIDLNEQISKGEHFNEQASQGKSIEQTRAIQTATQKIEDFAKENNLTKQQSADILAAASGKVPFADFLSGDVRLSGTAFDQDTYRKAERLAQSDEFQKSMREAAHASQSLSYSMTDEKSKRLSESVAGSYETGENFREEAMKSYRTSEDFQHQASHTKAFASSINANYTQEFVEWLGNQRADNTHGRIGGQRAAHIMANDPNMRIKYAEQFMREKGLLASSNESKGELETANELKNSYENDRTTDAYQVSYNSLTSVREKGNQEGVMWNPQKEISLRKDINTNLSDGEQKILEREDGLNNQYDQKEIEHGNRRDRHVLRQATIAEIQQVTGLFSGHKIGALESVAEKKSAKQIALEKDDLIKEMSHKGNTGEGQTKN